MDLFTHASEQRMKSEAPLAARMRPRTLDEFVGQEDILGPGKLLRRAIEADRMFSSILLWGPPGTGKTTLAQVIANTTKSHFETLSAVLAGKAELREVIDRAQERRKLYGTRTVLFVKDVVETLN
jgi:putative ATPase